MDKIETEFYIRLKVMDRPGVLSKLQVFWVNMKLVLRPLVKKKRIKIFRFH